MLNGLSFEHSQKELHSQHFQIQVTQGSVSRLCSIFHNKVSLRVRSAKLAYLGFTRQGVTWHGAYGESQATSMDVLLQEVQ